MRSCMRLRVRARSPTLMESVYGMAGCRRRQGFRRSEPERPEVDPAGPERCGHADRPRLASRRRRWWLTARSCTSGGGVGGWGWRRWRQLGECIGGRKPAISPTGCYSGGPSGCEVSSMAWNTCDVCGCLFFVECAVAPAASVLCASSGYLFPLSKPMRRPPFCTGGARARSSTSQQSSRRWN